MRKEESKKESLSFLSILLSYIWIRM